MSLCIEGRQLLNKLPKKRIKRLLLLAIGKIDLHENSMTQFGEVEDRDWKEIARHEQCIFEDLLQDEMQLNETLKGKGK